MKLLVLSDDLTGALDTGVQFAQKGISTSVMTKVTARRIPHESEVVVVNTSSRHMAATEAAERIRDSIASLTETRTAESLFFYKKTDSLLRGNVGAEIGAAIDALPFPFLMFVPAFPNTNRFTRGGVQYLEDTPIHLTSFASDRLNPIVTSNVVALVEEGIREAGIDDIEVESVTPEMAPALKPPSSPTGPKRVYVFDASSNAELSSIAQNLGRLELLRLSAGCAGFASALPQIVGFASAPARDLKIEKPLLIINGSMTELSRKQVEHAVAAGFHRISLTLEEKLMPRLSEQKRGAAIAKEIGALLERRTNVIITTSPTEPVAEHDYAHRHGVSVSEIALLISRNLASLSRNVLDASPVSSLVIFGGDTALAALRTLEIDRLIPIREIVPGIPLSLAEERGLTLVTKSGGFGEEDILSRLAQNTNSE